MTRERRLVDHYVATIRIVLGFIFLWAFVDKLFGFGFATPLGQGWLAGISPTAGYLTKATSGPFVGWFHTMAGSGVIEWLFMLGLLFIGVAFITGAALRPASIFGALMMALIFFSAFPPKANPFLDDHVIYFFLFLAYGTGEFGHPTSFDLWWKKTAFVKSIPFFG